MLLLLVFIYCYGDSIVDRHIRCTKILSAVVRHYCLYECYNADARTDFIARIIHCSGGFYAFKIANVFITRESLTYFQPYYGFYIKYIFDRMIFFNLCMTFLVNNKKTYSKIYRELNTILNKGITQSNLVLAQ